MMPVMDGLTATKTIRSSKRQEAKTIPIFAMTANAFLEDKKQSQEAGMNEHYRNHWTKKVDEYDLEIYARKATIIIAGWKKVIISLNITGFYH